ncbi:hypothetical protein A3860_18505 [Niastella vici]|uniref:Polyvalent protein metallopeptidase domain-containing protein n=1 Tax=Niastella vici TaxID=1703345 RepID=A0A1V9G2A4_9BACT|nr:zincin-like metallopeptidase domain-containing protein [Niastella vici]OQP64751.1 hypothetical protein A3860_18505 [Niastella vici]
MTTKNTSALDSAYVIVNAIFSEKLARGEIPWHASCNEYPKDIDGQLFRGVNVWLLTYLQYSRHVFLTPEQIEARNLCLKISAKKEHFIITSIKGKKNRSLGVCEVYNVDQVEGLNTKKFPQAHPAPRYLRLYTDIYDLMPNPPNVIDKGSNLYYDIEADTIHLPLPDSFKNDRQWYSALFYALVLSTYHPSRLNRQSPEHRYSLDRRLFSCDELAIEMGCSLLCSYTGIEPWYLVEHYKNAEGWLRKIESDPMLVSMAALLADQSVSYILNLTYQ